MVVLLSTDVTLPPALLHNKLVSKGSLQLHPSFCCNQDRIDEQLPSNTSETD